MKQLLLLLCMSLGASGLLAQKRSDPQPYTGSTALQEKSLESASETGGSHVYLQVGNPIPYSSTSATDGANFSIRFPWDVAYIPLTFEEPSFEVSKGYFSDKVQLNWTILSNRARIEQIRIYRREYRESYADDVSGYALIATLSNDSYTYDDPNTQGGRLYEYKVEAAGVSSIPRKYVTYISGVGYRNPTGVVTGNISFEGSSPVKDVVVRADPQGGELLFGNSLRLEGNGLLEIALPKTELRDKITLQAWLKFSQNSTDTLFRLQNNQLTTQEVVVAYTKAANSFSLTVSHTGGAAKTFQLANFYPNGNVDGRGNDLFHPFTSAASPQTDFANTFVHLSVVLEQGKDPLLYLNGRNMSPEYVASLPDYLAGTPSISTSGAYPFTAFETRRLLVAQGLRGNIDEIRLWKSVLSETQIRTDFKRYLGGSESQLVAYLRCDEGAGGWAYDISKVGIEFNKNHARIHRASWTSDKPTASQLGILGVTDALGNYIISAIPFSGAGESYTLTPMFGVHQFEPAQQLVFVGKGSEVINKIDFKDISSFEFSGVVAYTTHGVFAPIQVADGLTPGSVAADGYNQYRAILNGREQLLSQAGYYYDTSDPANPVLYETPKVFVPGAHVYVDGNIVLDKNKRPVETDANGYFKIRVPIGNHYIEVRKDKHHFMHAGRFPAAREDANDLFEFFEHQQAPVTFLDTTRVTLVGRVVGGTREAARVIGFGNAGPVMDSYLLENGVPKTDPISSINNIGQASLTLEYLPAGAMPGGELRHSFSTHPQTGEYRVRLLPLSYTIPEGNGLRIGSNPGLQLLSANEIINLSQVPDPQHSEYVKQDGSRLASAPYHFVKSVTYRSVPVLEVVSQASDLEVMAKQLDASGNLQQVLVSTEGFAYPIYTQGGHYAILFRTFEEYLNLDAGADAAVADRVPISDGEFNITNNLALANSERIEVDADDASYSTYHFRAGLPSISSPFTRSLDIRYRVGGKDYDARNYQREGIILGGQSDGSQTFVTQAPDIPDIILRDPPGSNSSASIQKGKSVSFTEEGSFAIGQEANYKIEMKLGTKIALGGGLAGPIIESEAVNSITGGISMKVESVHGKSITKTYTFNETISTSDDPRYVGSMGDLYIGNTKNYYYGTYDNIQSNMGKIPNSPSLQLTNAEGVSLYVSKQKAFYFAEEPSETFFIYSQRHILETLIPELQGIIRGIETGAISEGTPGVLTKAQYQEQIRLWKKVIQDNEKTKYAVLHQREQLKAEIKANLEKQIKDLNDHIIAITTFGAGAAVAPPLVQIGAQSLTEAIVLLEAKKANLKKKQELLETEFARNISFDAGLGEFTRSTEIAVAQQKTTNLMLDLAAELETTLGFHVNKTGLLLHTTNNITSNLNAALSEEDTESTLVSYTLKDGDKGNFLSVDVLSTFDGNGPVFSTVGGRTSCPYEGIDRTRFYNHAAYTADTPIGRTTTIYGGGDQISYATQRVEIPAISVEVASVTDVPETRAAEFKLILENNSTAGADAFFEIYVDNTTNPHNAKINLLPNGQVVFVPYGQKVEYALTLEKSLSDVYEYKDITIVLGSLCDPLNEYATVQVSAIFRPSCTAVQIDRPRENWVFNTGAAYNLDGTTNPMPVALFGYNRAFSGFQKFTLEYRRATSSSWTRLQTYYNSQELLEAAQAQGEDQGSLISANTTHFAWDIAGMGLADGPYELRVISYCSNGTEFISDVIRGTVDLNAPQQFGTPSPANGILAAGDDLRVRFSEPVTFNSALSKIEIKGETNQQQIDHNVSVYFAGTANTLLIEQPNVVAGDFALEFWLKSQTANGVLMEQAGGLKVAIENGQLAWTHGGKTIIKPMAQDGAFHHYTLTYHQATDQLRMYQDDRVLGALEGAGVQLSTSNHPLIIGGNSFVGNLHDLRFWAKSLSLSEAYAAQFKRLTGSERDLIGYWPMQEGQGELARDLARFKHAQMRAAWDIKPKGTAYHFSGGQYQELDNVNFVQLTDQMDVTLSFWLKTADAGKATLFSNGRGNGDDLLQTNGKANKWAVSLEGGILYLHSEGNAYRLSTTNLADNRWHHVGVVLRRIGNLRTYIDARQESVHPVRDIGGLSGNKFWIGARGHINSALQQTLDEPFTGQIDELRLWNLARAAEQLERDRFREIDFNSLGLMLYARMNQPEPPTGAGPRYYHKAANETMLSSSATLSGGAVRYTEDAPPIQQLRPYLSFQVAHVINGDELILTPMVSDWSVLEGQILDITVDRMFDVHGNRQSSPITWTAFVRRNEVSWHLADGSQRLSIQKEAGQPYSFTVTLLNKGGKRQPYAVENLPTWLSGANTSGTLEPNSSRTLTFSIDPELNVGQYTRDLYLKTDFNYDEKLMLDLRVLAPAPAWAVDPSAWEHSMNIIGKLKLNGAFSQDPQSRVAAYVGSELRGVAALQYDAQHDEYFAFLTVYSNQASGEEVSFKIWDATKGKVFLGLMNGAPSTHFIKNEVIGSRSAPAIFENTDQMEQLLSFRQGWTWLSVYAQDARLGNLNQLTETLQLSTNDLLKSQHHFDLYDAATGWNGSLSGMGGLDARQMYKLKLAQANTLRLQGRGVDLGEWKATLSNGWNWLGYPISHNVSLNDALALLQAREGDVIKNQTAFAIYDPRTGWSGTLRYLEAGGGYMLRTSRAQEFRYPLHFNNVRIHSEQPQPLPQELQWQAWEHSMNLVAEVFAGQEVEAVWALDAAGNIRGWGNIELVEGRRLSFITLYGQGAAADRLYLQLGTGQDRLVTGLSLPFEANQVLGSLQQPVPLRALEQQSGVFPNPFRQAFGLTLRAHQAQEVSLQLTNTLGHEVHREVRRLQQGTNLLELAPALPTGVYVLRVVVDGTPMSWKIIKTN
ncbi:LamG-like jellyroll fold domain-containing protein [Cesiribacter andamanensis]|nr:LamG-like jellyroll fold domain-containing protein [Cesiribacter andamanensis]